MRKTIKVISLGLNKFVKKAIFGPKGAFTDMFGDKMAKLRSFVSGIVPFFEKLSFSERKIAKSYDQILRNW